MDNNFVAMARCFACGQAAHILLHTRFHNIQEAHNKVDPRHPFCKSCQTMLAQGNTILLSVRDGEEGENPYRTGRMCVMTPQGTSRLFKGKAPPIAFIEDKMWADLGLPMENDDHSDPKDATTGWISAQCQKCNTWRGVRPEWHSAKQDDIIKARCYTCQPNQDEGYEMFPHKLDLYNDHGPKKTETQDAPPSAPEGEAGTQGVSDSTAANPEAVVEGKDSGVGSGDSGVEPEK